LCCTVEMLEQAFQRIEKFQKLNSMNGAQKIVSEKA
jgi:hypothetical protein